MNILFVGDVVGRAGRRALKACLPQYLETGRADFVVANAENAAGGIGLTPKVVEGILALGVDAVTTGNHVWAHREMYEAAEREPRLVRPANYPPGVPGVGSRVLRSRGGVEVGVVNVCGRVFMEALDCPFRAADAELERLSGQATVIIVDMHAEATSEKMAFGRYVDGRASLVAGTHTHVQTADERILPGGTAYITDCGMTGPVDSVIGMEAEPVVGRFLDRLPIRFQAAKGPAVFAGVLVEADDASGRAQSVVRVQEYVPAA